MTDASVLRQIVEDHKLLNPRPYDCEPVRLIAESIDVSGNVEESVRLMLHILQSHY